MTTFTFTCYSNALASLLLLHITLFIYRSNRPPLLITFLCGSFVLGFIRMEKFNCKSSTTIAKSIGTLVSIMGALMVTLYQGPSILGISANSNMNPFNTTSRDLTSSPAWVLGGSLLAIDSLIAAIFIIALALVVKKCPAELLLMLFYSGFIAILTASASLIVRMRQQCTGISCCGCRVLLRHVGKS